MAITWAIRKCEFYLRGLEFFEVLTDHRPLVGTFKKSLNMLENPRLRRMREKVIEYCFEVKWVEGKSHYIADALSRAPVFQAQEEELTADCAISCLQAKHTEIIDSLNRLRGREYNELITAVKEGKDLRQLPACLLYTSPSPRDQRGSRMPSSA